jgi:hypothetical protein
MNWLRSYLANNTADSSKRLIAFISAVVLCLAVLILAEAISYQGHKHWAIDAALVTAFLGVVGFVAALAREIYRKPEDGGTNA